MDLVGKKILVIHTRKYLNNNCFESVVVGADPEIGICVAMPGREDDPWFVYHGPLSPIYSEVAWKPDQTLLINNFCLDQLKSGYLSIHALDKFIDSLGAISSTRAVTNCPYSM